MGKPSFVPVMMTGTDGHADYFCFARKGKVALGIKPYGITDGEKKGLPGTTQFILRLRSADGSKLFPASPDAVVVQLKQEPKSFAEAWPEVMWDDGNESAKRASTSITVFMPGTVSGSVEERKQLRESIASQAFSTKLADYLISLAGETNLVVSRKQMIEWFNHFYGQIMQKIDWSLERDQLVKKALKDHVGVFGMSAEILKKVHDSLVVKADEAAKAEADKKKSDKIKKVVNEKYAPEDAAEDIDGDDD